MIKLFYHLALMNNWREVTRFFLESIVSSGLYDECSSFDVVFVGDGNPTEEFSGLYKVKIEHGGGLDQFEFPTLKRLYQTAGSSDANLLYIHSKGVSFDVDRWNAESETIKRQYCGRRYETYEDVQSAYRSTRYWNRRAIIEGFRECVYFLDQNDVVCLKHTPHQKFVPSNFWWTKSSYVRGLGEPLIKNNRYDAEMWLVNQGARIKTIMGNRDEYGCVLF
jgi:hypothetical protein